MNKLDSASENMIKVMGARNTLELRKLQVELLTKASLYNTFAIVGGGSSKPENASKLYELATILNEVSDKIDKLFEEE